jgi:hypothetical protein
MTCIRAEPHGYDEAVAARLRAVLERLLPSCVRFAAAAP